MAPLHGPPRPARVVDQGTLLTHAALVGLTPLIPIPLLDDAVKGAIERRLVREIGRAHGRTLGKEEVLALTDDGASLLWSVAKGILTFPFKLLFRKVFVVLEVKRASDEASRCYHRGLLLDLALGARALAPEGPVRPDELRKALDRTCDEVKVSPLGAAFRAALEGSKSGLAALGRALLGRLGAGGATDDARVEAAVDASATGGDGPLAAIVAKLKAAVDEVPAAHYLALEDRFEAILGVPLRREERRG